MGVSSCRRRGTVRACVQDLQAEAQRLFQEGDTGTYMCTHARVQGGVGCAARVRA